MKRGSNSSDETQKWISTPRFDVVIAVYCYVVCMVSRPVTPIVPEFKGPGWMWVLVLTLNAFLILLVRKDRASERQVVARILLLFGSFVRVGSFLGDQGVLLANWFTGCSVALGLVFYARNLIMDDKGNEVQEDDQIPSSNHESEPVAPQPDLEDIVNRIHVLDIRTSFINEKEYDSVYHLCGIHGKLQPRVMGMGLSRLDVKTYQLTTVDPELFVVGFSLTGQDFFVCSVSRTIIAAEEMLNDLILKLYEVSKESFQNGSVAMKSLMALGVASDLAEIDWFEPGLFGQITERVQKDWLDHQDQLDRMKRLTKDGAQVTMSGGFGLH